MGWQDILEKKTVEILEDCNVRDIILVRDARTYRRDAARREVWPQTIRP